MVLAQQQERSLTGEAGTVINNTCICCRSGSSQSQPELQALPAPSVLPIACHHGKWLAKGKRLLVPFLQAGPAKPCCLSYWHIYQLLQSIKGANTDSLVSAKPVKLSPKCSYTPKSCIGVYFYQVGKGMRAGVGKIAQWAISVWHQEWGPEFKTPAPTSKLSNCMQVSNPSDGWTPKACRPVSLS